MKVLKNSSLALLVWLQAASAQTLNPVSCSFIEAFNDKNDSTFLENFVFMNHNRELCSEGIDCEGPISKRTLPVSLTLGQYLPGDREVIDIALSSVSNIRAWLSKITDLDVQLVDRNSIPKLGTGFVRVEIVDNENATKILESKTHHAKDLFERFLGSDQIQCVGLNGDWSGAGLEYSEVWIKSSQSHEDISECLTEEIYHAFGVRSDPIGLASLYSDPQWVPEQTGSPNYAYPPSRDVWIMRLLYDPLIPNGADSKTSRRIANEIIRRDCQLGDDS